MWVKISSLIIKNRLLLLISTVLITLFMAYKAREVELTYDFVKVIPQDDPDFIYFNQFKKTFGEDGNILVVGLKDESVFKLNKFQAFQKLTSDLAKVEGISGVVSLPTVQRLYKDTAQQKFVL